VIVAVGYDDEVNQVVLGTDGLLAHLAPGSIIAVSSTAKPDTVKALDARARPASVARRRQGRRGRARTGGLPLLLLRLCPPR
jgi:hypothetical protein